MTSALQDRFRAPVVAGENGSLAETERSELQRRYCAARQSPRKDRVRELRSQLHSNSRDLDAALEQLIAGARDAAPAGAVSLKSR